MTAPTLPLNVLIVDDEALARLRLRALLQSMPNTGSDLAVVVAGEASDAAEALLLLESLTVDVLLLDIRMPGRNPAQAGLRLAASLKAMANPPAVVFVTAHSEHAVAAFDLDAIDYLTKPVRRERLAAALQRVQQRLRPAAGAAPVGPALVVNDRGRVLRLPFDEVLYLRAEQKYVTLRSAERSYLLDEPLSELQARLGDGFIRVHRNALVAQRAIRELALRDADADVASTSTSAAHDEGNSEGWAVRVAPLDEWLAVSRRQVAAVRAALGAAPSNKGTSA